MSQRAVSETWKSQVVVQIPLYARQAFWRWFAFAAGLIALRTHISPSICIYSRKGSWVVAWRALLFAWDAGIVERVSTRAIELEEPITLMDTLVIVEEIGWVAWKTIPCIGAHSAFLAAPINFDQDFWVSYKAISIISANQTLNVCFNLLFLGFW